MGTSLQVVGQEFRHGLTDGFAACSALHQGLSRLSAQQKPRSLGAVEPFVPGHGHKSCTQSLKIHRETAGRLGGVHDERYLPLPAQRRDVQDGQHIAKHVGHMGADHHICASFVQDGLKTPEHLLRLKQRPVRHLDLHIRNGMERSGDSIVLITGNQHPHARLHQGIDGEI